MERDPMPDIFSTPSALIVLYALGMETVVGGILAASNGLSEGHKDMLVSFAIGFPLLILLALLVVQRRGDVAVMAPAES